ncbi:hypothetical protein [Ruegeria marina]|uniref:Uncharacterized protein n=1 Tax=Ruegeria marina TaxID=639004 RepID=A0A1G7EHM6_9RHOB|nr:hypothetical protein [Ruegeria marina]SDE63164.1 hypothetical protein SAMN04488239_12550 [Ruegeria marina]
MPDGTTHSDQQAFEDFIQRELKALADRAQDQRICIDCLTDRLIVEMVASLARAGVPAADILSMVADGMTLAEEPEGREGSGRPPRMH